VAEARDLLRQESEGDRPLYVDVRKRDIDYARIRLVQEPLTPYLAYELIAYQIRTEIGENIEVVRCDPDLRLPSEDHFDFLLFDRHTALIHDYGNGETGRQSGGWLTHSAEVIATLERMALALRRTAVPLSEFLAEVRR
jgi:hypothetical protein